MRSGRNNASKKEIIDCSVGQKIITFFEGKERKGEENTLTLTLSKCVSYLYKHKDESIQMLGPSC